MQSESREPLLNSNLKAVLVLLLTVVFISLAALDFFRLLHSEQTKHSYTATFRSEHLPFSYAIQ